MSASESSTPASPSLPPDTAELTAANASERHATQLAANECSQRSSSAARLFLVAVTMSKAMAPAPVQVTNEREHELRAAGWHARPHHQISD